MTSSLPRILTVVYTISLVVQFSWKEKLHEFISEHHKLRNHKDLSTFIIDTIRRVKEIKSMKFVINTF